MEQFVEIDGSLYEGGGQMIRSSLALSTILKKQFQMHSIRKNRPNPGINNQLRSVFSAFTSKLPKVGDTQIYMYPQFQNPKHIRSPTAASITLMLQCFLPICAALGYNKSIKIEGGTDVSRSPCMQSINLGLMPLLQKMGVSLKVQDMKKGFYPTGGGYLIVKIDTADTIIKPIEFVNFAPPSKVVISYYLKSDKLPPQAKQFSRDVKNLLKNTFPQQKIDCQLKVERVFKTKEHYGIGCIAFGDNCVWDVGTVGEQVAQQTILDRLRSYCEKRVCLDEHHQDQLLLLCSLAAGVSKLRVGNELSLHTQSLLYVIRSFIPHFEYKHEDGILQIHGVGIKIKKQEADKSDESSNQ